MEQHNYDNFRVSSAAFQAKRAQLSCESMRVMFKKVKRGKGQHLISMIEPHFETCLDCQKWAQKRKWNTRQILSPMWRSSGGKSFVVRPRQRAPREVS